jgi:NADH dehydrogenase/NADH:ubiquinone oxidoreductase subunit G
VILQNDLAGLEETAEAALRDAKAVVALATDANATTEIAQVVLPIRNYAEKPGTFVNAKGRAQALSVALAAPTGSLDAVEVLGRIGKALGHDFAWSSSGELLGELVATVEGFAALGSGIAPEGVDLNAPASSEVQS